MQVTSAFSRPQTTAWITDPVLGDAKMAKDKIIRTVKLAHIVTENSGLPNVSNSQLKHVTL